MQGRSVPTWLALASVLTLAAPDAGVAQATASHVEGGSVLVLAPSERVTLRLDAGGRLEIESIAPAEAVDSAPPRAGGRPMGPKDPLITTPSGTVALILGQVGDATWLKIENGTPQAFDYNAWAPKTGGGLEPTNVCTVLPLLAGYEQWPGRRLPRLVLNRFTPRATNSVDCPQPTGPPPAVPGL